MRRLLWIASDIGGDGSNLLGQFDRGSAMYPLFQWPPDKTMCPGQLVVFGHLLFIIIIVVNVIAVVITIWLQIKQHFLSNERYRHSQDCRSRGAFLDTVLFSG